MWKEHQNRTRVIKKKGEIVFDFLMGVGARYYPTPLHFIAEALRLGVSKRIPFLPKGLKFGKSKIWLVHWGTKEIFGFFIPTEFDIIGKVDKKFVDIARKHGAKVREISPEEAAAEPQRGCGRREVGGGYICSYNDTETMQRVIEEAKDLVLLENINIDLAGPLVVLKHPIPYKGGFFRGIRYVKVFPKERKYVILKIKWKKRKKKTSIN